VLEPVLLHPTRNIPAPDWRLPGPVLSPEQAAAAESLRGKVAATGFSTTLLDGVTGIEHSMGRSPFYDDVVKFWVGTTAGMTPTLLVGYNVALGEAWYHQTSKLWLDPKLTRFITPEQLMRVRSPVGAFRFDLAYGQETSSVRLHFSLGVRF